MHFAIRPLVSLLAVTTAAALAACGGGDEPPTGLDPAISLALSTTSLSVAQGGSGTATISITRSGGFAGPVALAVEGAPDGVTATAEPGSVAGATATLTVAASAAAAPGNYTLTVRGTGTGVTAQAVQLALVVTATSAAGFSLAVAPSTLGVAQGATGTAQVTITRGSGFTGTVDLTVSGAPTGVTATLNPASTTATASTLTVTAAASAAPGAYTLTITGAASGVASQTATVALTVTGTVVSARGTIAYVRDHKEIRLIEPDGSNDRLLWAHPRPDVAENLGIVDLAWRPDGGELAFASQHEATHSLFESDLYAIRPDGSGLRRLTNPPAVAELGNFPKGTVRVTIRNDASNVGDPDASGFFLVYVVGASDPQTVTVGPGSSATLTFTNVADLGGMTQPTVAINGEYRWFNPGVDVRAGATVDAPTLDILNKVRSLGAMSPFWRQDASLIGYRALSGCAGLWAIAPTGSPGLGIGSPIAGTNEMLACQGTWGPTPALADQVLHTGPFEDNTVYRVHENGTGRVELLHSSDWVPGAVWLPDGSGFVYLKAGEFLNSMNLYRFDFATQQTTPITEFTSEFVRSFSIAPDGEHVVFERSDRLFQFAFDPPPQTALWIVGVDGSGARLLVENAETPAW
jgi:hypothetical protein